MFSLVTFALQLAVDVNELWLPVSILVLALAFAGIAILVITRRRAG